VHLRLPQVFHWVQPSPNREFESLTLFERRYSMLLSDVSVACVDVGSIRSKDSLVYSSVPGTDEVGMA